MDPLDPEAVATRVLDAEHKFPGSYVCRALAGVDTALWDLRGRLEGLGVSELLGAPAAPIDAYASSMRRDIAPADEAGAWPSCATATASRRSRSGSGRECGHDEDEWPGRTEAVVPAVRDARRRRCAPARRRQQLLHARAGRSRSGGFSSSTAWCTSRSRARTGSSGGRPRWRARSTLDVAGGEQDCLLSSWRQIVERRAVDIVQPDVCYVGGFTRALAVAAMAADAGLPCVPHSANLSLVTIFALHLLAVVPNAGPYVEFSIEGPDYYPWQDGLFTPPLEVSDGRVTAPEGPGWGVEIAPEWLACAAHRTSAA